MNTVYLGLGSNLGNREELLKEAIALISIIGRITKQSSLYESEPWGFKHKNNFLNMVIEVKTLLEPLEVLDKITEIEAELGRVRTKEGYSARIIDIDILFYDNLSISIEQLTIPHPHIAKRKFVLEPLQEISPDFIHPVLQKTSNQLCHECPDTSEVRKLTI